MFDLIRALFSRPEGRGKKRQIHDLVETFMIEHGVSELGSVILSVTYQPNVFPVDPSEQVIQLLVGVDTREYDKEMGGVTDASDYLRDRVISQGLRVGFCSEVWPGDNDCYYFAVPDAGWEKDNVCVIECQCWIPGIHAGTQKQIVESFRDYMPAVQRIIFS